MRLIQDEKEASKKYELEVEEINCNGKEKVKIVKLTSDNVARVEAMIKTGFGDNDPENKKLSTFWLIQLKEIIDSEDERSKDGFSYECIMEKLIKTIDKENRTHLNSDTKGFDNVKQRVVDIKRKELKQYLEDPGDEYELINIIQTPEKEGEKCHFSFATKFCHYVCLCLFEGTEAEDRFSIYDGVLKKTLPRYIKKYLGEDVKEKEYENNYHKYIKYIDRIRDKASEIEACGKISRNGFDQLLWYYHRVRN